MNTAIITVLAEINKVMGTNLQSSDSKITKKFGKKFFNVELSDRVVLSRDYTLLQRYANTYKKIDVQPNGVNKVAIFII
jgi:hypothetical protein